MKFLRRSVQRVLGNFGYKLCPYNRNQIIPGQIKDLQSYRGPEDFSRLYRPWLDEKYDRYFIPEVVNNTMLSRKKLYYLLHFLRHSLGIDGDVLEAGVGDGGSARLMLNCLLASRVKKKMWLLDTFAGYKKVDAVRDGRHLKENDCRCQSRDYVIRLMENDSLDVNVIEGVIPATLSEVKTETVAFAHIDVNLYEPTLTATAFCLKRMPRGGIVLFDDYNWPATYGHRMAIDELCISENQDIISIAESTQAFLIKR